MKIQKANLYSTVSSVTMLALALGAASPVAAQSDDDQLEEIIVSGIRGGLRQALNVKRNATAQVDAISAEDIGKFPDKNIAESLQRIPGVTIQRAFGEGSDVSVRGAGAGFTKTSLNGQNVASTGWFVFEPARRSFNYTLLPSELVGGIELYKSPQADLLEGGVGGTVVINTRKPLDLDSMSIYGSVEASHTDDSGSVGPQTSALLSWKNDAETFGVIVSGVYQERELQRQGTEAFWTWGAGPVAFQQDRERRALTATLQYQPNENLDVVMNVMDMEMSADNTNYALWLTRGSCADCDPPVADSDKISETPARGPLNVAFSQLRPREATMKSKVYDFDVTYTGDTYELDLQVGHTKASGGTDFEMVLDDGLGGTALPGATYDFFGGSHEWDLAGFDPATYEPGLNMGTGANFNKTPKTDKETYLQADLEYAVDYGVIHSLKFGAKYADHNSTSRRYDFTQADSFVNGAPTSVTGLIDATSAFEIPEYDVDAIKDWAKASITDEVEDLGSYSEIEEKNFAAYAMASFEGEGFRGNFGVRYVNTDATSVYYLDGQRQEADGGYSEFLPSINIALDAAENVTVRASAARVLTRPNYVDMYVNPNVTGADDDLPNNQRWIVGNVDLEPFISDQIDLAVEWYFAEGSILSGAVFFKDVKNFITDTEYAASSTEIPFAGTLRPDEITNGWIVEELFNGGDAQIKGFEVQYQQEFANGFGAIANYTYTDSEVDASQFGDANTVLTDSSKHAYNISGYYENDRFNARVSYNWRSKYMLREVGAYGNRLHDDFGSLDLSGSFFVNDNVTVKLDVVNLLKDDVIQTGNNQVPSPNSGFANGFPLYQYETARQITVGLSFKY